LLVAYQASADAVSAVFIPSVSAQHHAGGRNIFAPAVTQLLMLRCPGGAGTDGAVLSTAGLLSLDFREIGGHFYLRHAPTFKLFQGLCS
jgi:hypothetical protein